MIDILFSKICLLCDNSSKKTIICRSCSEAFSFIDNASVCDICGVPFSSLSGAKITFMRQLYKQYREFIKSKIITVI